MRSKDSLGVGGPQVLLHFPSYTGSKTRRECPRPDRTPNGLLLWESDPLSTRELPVGPDAGERHRRPP